MTEKIGFIGAGNMGKAIISGLLTSKLYAPENIVVYDAFPPTIEAIKSELKVGTAESSIELAEQVDFLILAVKPNIILDILDEIKAKLSPTSIVISIAAGISIEQLEGKLAAQQRVVRVMPNTPALVGEGMSAVVFDDTLDEVGKQKVLEIFKSFGKAEIVSEYLIDSVVGVSGSAPAYVYMFIESLADGAVLAGMPRKQAYEFAAQTVFGSAKMVLESGKHPGELKDMVCSPGGTTIKAVEALEQGNFRATVMAAVTAAAEKNKSM